jgi:isoleucyl-tRNA synthetase
LGRIESNKEDLSDSIFLESFPAVNQEIMSEDLAGWSRLLLTRDDVNLAIETKRKEGLIGSSLESKVILTIKDRETYELWKKQYIDGSKDSLKAIFIVSQVELKLDESLEEARKIEILHADGKKCPRCWNWFVGDTGEICGRCGDAING